MISEHRGMSNSWALLVVDPPQIKNKNKQKNSPSKYDDWKETRPLSVSIWISVFCPFWGDYLLLLTPGICILREVVLLFLWILSNLVLKSKQKNKQENIARVSKHNTLTLRVWILRDTRSGKTQTSSWKEARSDSSSPRPWSQRHKGSQDRWK